MALSDYLGPVSSILAGAGASNWLFTQFLNVNLVEMISFGFEPIGLAAYGLAGLAGIGSIWSGTQALMDRLA